MTDWIVGFLNINISLHISRITLVYLDVFLIRKLSRIFLRDLVKRVYNVWVMWVSKRGELWRTVCVPYAFAYSSVVCWVEVGRVEDMEAARLKSEMKRRDCGCDVCSCETIACKNSQATEASIEGGMI